MLKVIFTNETNPALKEVVRTLDEAATLLRMRLSDDSVDLFLLNAKHGASFQFGLDGDIINLSVVTEH